MPILPSALLTRRRRVPLSSIACFSEAHFISSDIYTPHDHLDRPGIPPELVKKLSISKPLLQTSRIRIPSARRHSSQLSLQSPLNTTSTKHIPSPQSSERRIALLFRGWVQSSRLSLQHTSPTSGPTPKGASQHGLAHWACRLVAGGTCVLGVGCGCFLGNLTLSYHSRFLSSAAHASEASLVCPAISRRDAGSSWLFRLPVLKSLQSRSSFLVCCESGDRSGFGLRVRGGGKGQLECPVPKVLARVGSNTANSCVGLVRLFMEGARRDLLAGRFCSDRCYMDSFMIDPAGWKSLKTLGESRRSGAGLSPLWESL